MITPRRTKTLLIAAGLAGTTAMAAVAVFAADGPRTGRMFNPERMAERANERCERMSEIDRHLTAAQVKDIITGRLAERGDTNLKVGKAVDKADGVISVEIVTKSGSLVNVRELSAKTGLPVGAEQRCADIAERISAAVGDDDEGRRGFRDRMKRRFGGREDGPGGGMLGGRMGEMALIGNFGPERDLNLTKDQAKQLAEAGLIVLGNPRLKVGAVTEKDADTYTVDIVTADNALVMQREIDRHTGRPDRDGRGRHERGPRQPD